MSQVREGEGSTREGRVLVAFSSLQAGPACMNGAKPAHRLLHLITDLVHSQDCELKVLKRWLWVKTSV